MSSPFFGSKISAAKIKSTSVFVAKSSLPALDAFMKHVTAIFDGGQLTNNGPLQQKLEQGLAQYLGLTHLTLCNNGTIALQLAIRLLGLAGKKVITTPFSYVATVSALLWEGCTPVFADIDPNTLCLSPAAVEEALLRHPDTAGILPVHVFGNACDVHALERICQEQGIPCLYDAAHAFGSNFEGSSLLDFGDAAICSFHATKLFHSVEGGCIVTHCPEARNKAELLRAFGHIGDTHISLGINGKISELHAAMGLCLLPLLHENIQKRKKLHSLYTTLLGLDQPDSCAIRTPVHAPGLEYNYAYYPVLFKDEATLLRVKAALEAENIFPRRYFYPSLTQLPYLPGHAGSCPVAEKTALSILCLPFYPELPVEQAEQIASIVKGALAG